MQSALDINSLIAPLRAMKPEKIVLFGSYAYGHPSEDSDIDLLVVTDTDESFHDRISRVRALLPKDKPIDLIILTPSEYLKTKSSNPLISEIEAKGRVIYG